MTTDVVPMEGAKVSDGVINFEKGKTSLYVNFADYISKNNIDLSAYDQVKVTYQLKNADGTDATAYTDAPEWANFSLAGKAADLTGYTHDKGLTGSFGNKIADTAYFDITKIGEGVDVSSVVGVNLQVQKMDADKYLAVTEIAFYKNNNVEK